MILEAEADVSRRFTLVGRSGRLRFDGCHVTFHSRRGSELLRTPVADIRFVERIDDAIVLGLGPDRITFVLRRVLPRTAEEIAAVARDPASSVMLHPWRDRCGAISEAERWTNALAGAGVPTCDTTQLRARRGRR